MKAATLLTALTLLIGTIQPSTAGITAKDFADRRGLVSEQKAREYWIASGNVPLAKVLKKGSMSFVPVKVKAETDDMVSYWNDTFGPPPWKHQDIDGPAKPEEPPRTPGFTAPMPWDPGHHVPPTGTRGPFRLRQDIDNATRATVDKKGEPDTDALAEVKGATLGFTNNRLIKGSGAWNSMGALAYPFDWETQGRRGTSTLWSVLPALQWNVAETEATAEKDIQEIGFYLPISAYRTNGKGGGWDYQISPFYETDFSWEHEIYGAVASLEYTGPFFGTDIQIGGFDFIEGTPIAYQIRLVPKLDYSEVARGGAHTARLEGEDWFRAGALASFDLTFGKKDRRISTGASYEFHEEIGGGDDSSHLFKAHLTYPLSDFVALSLKYDKGNTPIADKEIDQITLNLELKY